MSKFLTPENEATRPDASYFSPERLSKLKRIFDSVCKEEAITSEADLDYIACSLLEAAKLTNDRQTLIEVMKYDIAALRK